MYANVDMTESGCRICRRDKDATATWPEDRLCAICAAFKAQLIEYAKASAILDQTFTRGNEVITRMFRELHRELVPPKPRKMPLKTFTCDRCSESRELTVFPGDFHKVYFTDEPSGWFHFCELCYWALRNSNQLLQCDRCRSASHRGGTRLPRGWNHEPLEHRPICPDCSAP